MKKSWYTLILLCFAFSIDAVSWQKALDYYVWGYRKPTWKHGHIPFPEEVEKQKKLFGYDLSITHIRDRARWVSQNQTSRIKLFVHGFAENKNQAMVHAGEYHVLPGDFITFNLPDRVTLFPPFTNRLHKTSFGQLNEVLPLLYVMNYVKKKLNYQAFDLFGFSRGAAVIVNALAVLCDDTGKYDKALKKIGVNAQDRQEIIDSINAGSLVLRCPLRDMKDVDEQRAYGLAAKIFWGYSPNGMHPIDSINKIAPIKTNTLIHFQHNDTHVTNKKEAKYYASFARLNPSNTFLHLGNDGGHKANPKSLSYAIQAFYQNIGASSDQVRLKRYQDELQKRSQKGIHLRQPSPMQVEQEIADYYAHCKKRQLSRSS